MHSGINTDTETEGGTGCSGLVVSDERQIMTVGNSLGITLPPTILDALDLDKGDAVEVTRKDGNAVFQVRAADQDE